MTPPYSTAAVQAKLDALGLPFAEHVARALVALLTARKISLHHVAHLMPGEHNPEANRMQMRRCLDHESMTQEAWSRALAALLPRTKWTLALDRTEWKRGETRINLLVLAVVTHGCADECFAFIAVPLLWTVLPDCGASDTAERQELLSRFVTLFGKEQIRFVTADREFIGHRWISWLLNEQIPFRIRITRAGTGTRPASTCPMPMAASGVRGNGSPSGHVVASRRRCSCGDCPSLSEGNGCPAETASSI